jgi:hypothetical protein
MYNNALDSNNTGNTINIQNQQQQQPSRIYSSPLSPMVNMQQKIEPSQFQHQYQQHLPPPTPPQQQPPTPQMLAQQQQQYQNQNNYYQSQFNNNPNSNQYQQQQLQHHLQQQQQQLNGYKCASCCSPINERLVIECSNRYWHHQCLRCNLCKKILSENERCFQKNDTIFCKEDYIK